MELADRAGPRRAQACARARDAIDEQDAPGDVASGESSFARVPPGADGREKECVMQARLRPPTSTCALPGRLI
jgi:hypothetical protein